MSKFQGHLKNIKSNPVKEQSIDSDETSLLESVLSLIEAPQGINSARMLSIRNESKSDPAEEQSIDFSKTPLPGSVLSLVGTP